MTSYSNWAPVVDLRFRRTARLSCPTCKKGFVLDRGIYGIDEVGVVSPPPSCPFCKNSLGILRLAGWPFEVDFT